jgi:hypothetical protein
VGSVQARNPHASITITIEQEMVLGFSRPNTNTYRDGKGVALAAHQLSAIDRGHVYAIRLVGKRVMIENTLRIADRETSALLSGLRSLRNENQKLLSGKWKDGPIHQPHALAYNWSLSEDDFEDFTNRLTELGGRVAEDHLSLSSLQPQVETITKLAARLLEELDEARDKLTICHPSKRAANIQTLGEISDEVEAAKKDIQALRRSLEQARRNPRLSTGEAAGITALASQVSEGAVAALCDTNWVERLVEASVSTSAGTKLHISLESEIERLRKTFPVLRCLSALSDDCVRLRLGSATVTIERNGFTVDGSVEEAAGSATNTSSRATSATGSIALFPSIADDDEEKN